MDKILIPFLFLLALASDYAAGQSVNVNVVRLSPTELPTTCNIGDLRVDSDDDYKLKMCGIANTWGEITPTGILIDPMTTDGDLITQASGVPARVAIGSAGTFLRSSGTAPAWGAIDSLQGRSVQDVSPSDEDVLTWNATASRWEPRAAQAPLPTYPAGEVLFGAGTNIPTSDEDLTFDGTSLTGSFIGDLTGNADTASALAADPTDCASDRYATGIAANGNLTCAQVSSAGLAGSIDATKIADGSISNTEFQQLNGVTSSLCGISQSCTLTNKGIDGDDNTISDLGLGVLKSDISRANEFVGFDGTGAPISSKVQATHIDSEAAAGGRVLKADGAGGASWESGSGSGGTNYAADLYEGTSTAGINTYDDGASATPTDCTGGTATGLTVGLNTGSPIGGTSNILLSRDGNDRQGKGFSYDFTMYPEDYEGGKRIYVKFKYNTTSGGGYVNNDMRVFVYDRDAGQLLNVLSLTGDGSIAKADTATQFVGSFSANPTSNDYRLCIHQATTTAAAADVNIRLLEITPEATVPGYIGDGWKTDTCTSTWTTNTTTTCLTRRVGDVMEIQWNVATSGQPDNVELDVNPPSGISIDTSKLLDTSGGSEYTIDGRAYYKDSGSEATASGKMVKLGGIDRIRPITEAGGNITRNAPFTWGSGDVAVIRAKFPVVDWLASAALSTNELMLKSSKALYSRASSTQTIESGTTEIVDFNTKELDSHSAVTTGSSWKYTMPSSGTADIRATVSIACGTTGFHILILYKNGSEYKRGSRMSCVGSNINGLTAAWSAKGNSGDYFDVRVENSSGANRDLSYTNGDTNISITFEPDFSLYGIIPGGPPRVTTYTSGSGTFTKHPATRWIRVRMVGGGGGGGGAANVVGAAGGGGGAGAYLEKIIPSPSASYAYAVGDGGVGGPSGNNTGTSGGNTSFGTLTANGGAGGTGSAGDMKAGGGGGTASGGDVNATGGHGGSGKNVDSGQGAGGDGGSSMFGSGGYGGKNSVVTAAAGAAYGSGGGGGGAQSGGQAGASGFGGIIIVEEHF